MLAIGCVFKAQSARSAPPMSQEHAQRRTTQSVDSGNSIASWRIRIGASRNHPSSNASSPSPAHDLPTTKSCIPRCPTAKPGSRPSCQSRLPRGSGELNRFAVSSHSRQSRLPCGSSELNRFAVSSHSRQSRLPCGSSHAPSKIPFPQLSIT